MSDLNSLQHNGLNAYHQSGVHILVQIVSLHNPVCCICDCEMQSDFIGLVGKEREYCLVGFPYLSLPDFEIVAILPL